MAEPTYNINDPNFIKSLTDIAKAQLQPTVDTGMQSIADQEAALRQQTDLANQGLNANETTIKQNADSLAQNLIKQAATAQGGLEEKYNTLGLLRSGMNAAGLGDIQSNLVKGQATNEQDKANQLADIALQRAGLTNTLDSGLKGFDNSRATLNNTYTTNLNDIVNQILTGARTAASGTAQGQTTYIPGVGYIQGTQAPAQTTVDLGNRIAVMDAQGNIVKSYAKGATPSSSGGGVGGVSDKLTSLLQTAQKSLAGGAGWGATVNPLHDVYGLDWNTIDSALRGTYNDAQKKGTSTNNSVNVAMQALTDLANSSNKINKGTSVLDPTYIAQYANNQKQAALKSSGDVKQLQISGEALISAIKALTNTGRITQAEINAYQLPNLGDTQVTAQKKITALANLLDKAQGNKSGTTSSKLLNGNMTAPTSGKLSSGLTFTVSK